jgi:hypothetical protein
MRGRTCNRDDKVQRKRTILIRGKDKERTRNFRRSDILVLYGSGLCMMKDGARRAIRMLGSVIVIVKPEGK